MNNGFFKKLLLNGFGMACALFLVSCSATPPKELRDSSMAVKKFGAYQVWNNPTPNAFFEGLKGEDKKWVKEKGGIWYIQEKEEGKLVRHYFTAASNTKHLLYERRTIDGVDAPPAI